ncbi:hypothetical protein K402DRAFT_323048 [Aulographum hederae CBS 113979]|uniref:Uncharacterized protein n=1 Tax=Aulographum hederae CBS 113979 TaxID=1176131 RepID=A0A6G1HE01_9PEZI|nr:hypothetical protein K402DRAFT_323048 [Aulographum hederae CBS 113979]
MDLSDPLKFFQIAASNPGSPISTGTKGEPAVTPSNAPVDESGGSGLYKANWSVPVPFIERHTIYAPKTPVAGMKMPIIGWAEGGCGSGGLMFKNFMTELASHGYMIIANGAPATANAAKTASTSQAYWITEGINWVVQSAEKKEFKDKYGEVDLEKIAVAGQSCGGLEAYSASYADERVKQTVLFNSGCLTPSKQEFLPLIKAPVSYFLGGVTDVGYQNGNYDFSVLSKRLPGLVASLDVGHLSTYWQFQGGAVGKVAVQFFNAVMKDDKQAQDLFKNPDTRLKTEGWNVTVTDDWPQKM